MSRLRTFKYGRLKHYHCRLCGSCATCGYCICTKKQIERGKLKYMDINSLQEEQKMRYWFESTEDEKEIGLQIAKWNRAGKIHMIEKGDPHEQVKESLHKVRNALETLQKFGISNDVMKTYIYAKCSRVSKSDIEQVFEVQKDFFRAMGLK